VIQAIIFDCFGVLTTDGWLPFRDRYFGDAPDLLEEARANRIRVDTGLMSSDDFLRWLSDKTGATKQDIRRQIEGNVPNEPLFTYIRDILSPKYKIGMLSNAGGNWLDELFEPWQKQLFDEIVLSFEVGVVKPDPLMYETIATRLAVLPSEAIFIDDLSRYIEGAKSVGMQGIQYQNFPQFVTDLEALLHA
jgi:putative hydrolase of the HAD superfamily